MSARTALAILCYVDRQRPPAVRRRLRDALASLDRTGYRDPVIIVDDGSSCGQHLNYLDRLASAGRHEVIRRESNGGISRAKNTCLRAIADRGVAIGFVAEDDVLFYEGWDQAYVSAMRRSGIHHFSWHPQHVENRVVVCNDSPVMVTGGVAGVFLTLTREVLTRIGGFKVLPHRYGYEHIQWTYRNILAGLAPFPTDILESHRFVGLNSLPSSLDRRDIESGARENMLPGYEIDRLFEPFEE